MISQNKHYFVQNWFIKALKSDMLDNSTVLPTVKYFRASLCLKSSMSTRIKMPKTGLFSNQACSWRCLVKVLTEFDCIKNNKANSIILLELMKERKKYCQIAICLPPYYCSLMTWGFNNPSFYILLFKAKEHLNYSDWLRTLPDKILFF